MTTDINAIEVVPQSAGWRLANLPIRSRKLGSGPCFIGRFSR